jgi:hypothetical protein
MIPNPYHIEDHHIMMPFTCDVMRGWWHTLSMSWQLSCVLAPLSVALGALRNINTLNEGVLLSISCVGQVASSAPYSKSSLLLSVSLSFFVHWNLHKSFIIQSFLLCDRVSMFVSFAPWFEYFVNPTNDHWGWDFVAGYELTLLSRWCMGVVKFLVQELLFLACLQMPTHTVFHHKLLQT